MSVVIDEKLRTTALGLVDTRSSSVETAGHDACRDFFDGHRTSDLWKFSVEARGDLAALRHRVAGGLPLDAEQRQILLNLTASKENTPEIIELRALLADG